MGECRPRVYVDYREKGSGVPEALSRLGAVVVYDRLGVGDYVVSDRVAVERKTVPDLAESLFDGRLRSQAARLASSYEEPYIVVEGPVETLERVTGRASSVLAALASLTIDHGVRVLWSLGPADTARLVRLLACREQGERRRPVVINRKPRLQGLQEQQLYLLQSLPGIGPRLAERLLERFGSVEAVCRASVVELARILGEERARRVYRVLHARWSREGGQRL